MAKRKTKAKRSLASLPKGLPNRALSKGVNPFEVAKALGGGRKHLKHNVNNRAIPSSSSASVLLSKPSKLAESLQRRQSQQRAALMSSKKVNSFVDRRIGEFDMSQEDKIMARIVKERSTRSKKHSKYSLNDSDDNDQFLTHKGRAIDPNNVQDYIMLDSDEEDGGNLDAMDTEMNFGGGRMDRNGPINPYKPSHSNTAAISEMAQVYSQKKNDLDEMIARRKALKAERVFSKERQEETFQSLDQGFEDLAQLLQFRDKETERKKNQTGQRGVLNPGSNNDDEDDLEMAEWDKEMKTYLFERKVKATDRTKTPEEIAKEEADRLHKLETKRLARMHGDFDHDDLSDISDQENDGTKRKNNRQRRRNNKPLSAGAEALDSSDNDEPEDDNFKVKFTADGLVYVDRNGKVVRKVGDEDNAGVDTSTSDVEVGSDASSDSEDEGESSEGDNDDHDGDGGDNRSTHDSPTILQVGMRVKANYRAEEQYDGQDAWHEGSVAQVHFDKSGNVTYDVDYDDGDFEDGVKPANIRMIKIKVKEQEKEAKQKEEAEAMKRKRQKAKEKARSEIPFVFEVPTTLDALHDMIANHASTGSEVSLIIDRIHASNSVRLNKRNSEKMQNFYDVLLRRFVAVGDAIFVSGNGGEELDRYEQLNALTRTLFAMSSDAPESAAAVWSRRLGVFYNAHAKRLRDAEYVFNGDDNDDNDHDETKTAWPSTGTLLLLRALAHIFPVTDRRHSVVTPALILLCQMVAQTPVTSMEDLVSGLFCCGMLIEYTREAKRVVPEALAFLSGVIGLFATKKDDSMSVAYFPSMKELYPRRMEFRNLVSKCEEEACPILLCLEKNAISNDSTPAAILYSTLHLVDQCLQSLGRGAIKGAEPEAFYSIANALLALAPQSSRNPLPDGIVNKITTLAGQLSDILSQPRVPLTQRSASIARQNDCIKTLAPRLQDPEQYRMSKDHGKNGNQAALDRSRREYKREHKAVARELRMDGAFAEQERRREQAMRDDKARAKRHKNFAWLESEQGAMNQQVALGGGLLSGGGMGAARAKAKSAKMGIKKGGKF